MLFSFYPCFFLKTLQFLSKYTKNASPFISPAVPGQSEMFHNRLDDLLMAVNKLHKIEVYDDLSNKIAEVEYTYQETLVNPHNDIGSFGDLVQVKTSKQLTDAATWQTRITQYRYYRTGNANGISHQLKMILDPDAVDRILAQNNLSSPEALLMKSDSESLSSGNSVASYASQAFTYYASNLNTSSSVTTPWGSENLSTKYGGTNI
jgi:hypothetical protein